MTEMNVKNADAVPNMASVLKVRGSDAKKGHSSDDSTEANCAETVTSHGVEVFGTGQAMQSLDESVVQEEHEGGSPPCPSLTPE